MFEGKKKQLSAMKYLMKIKDSNNQRNKENYFTIYKQNEILIVICSLIVPNCLMVFSQQMLRKESINDHLRHTFFDCHYDGKIVLKQIT